MTEERVTGARIIWCENQTHARRRKIGKTRSVVELSDVAEMLDRAAERNIDLRGNSGSGAGAYLEIVFNGDDPADDDSDGEAVESLGDSILAGLPTGAAAKVRAFISRQKRGTCWNGNNHVPAPYHHSQELLDKIRGR